MVMAMMGKLSRWTCALALVFSSAVGAVGLGDLSLKSYLNETLDAEVELLSLGKLGREQLHVLLASQDDFDRAGVPRDYYLQSLNFEVEVDDAGTGVILVTTDNKINEPYLNFLIEVRWPTGRLLREYTILLDPVVFTQSYESPAAESVVESSTPNRADSNSRAPTATTTTVAAPTSSDDRDYGSHYGDNLENDAHMVAEDDTLWTIAARLRPEGHSIHQTMLAIQRTNPKAFINGNINLVKAGYILRIPDEGEIGSRDDQYAAAEVSSQNRDWREGRSSGPIEGASRPQMDATADGSDARRSSGSDDGDGVLEIASGGQSQDDVGGDDLSNELIASYEDVDRVQRDLNDLQSRISELEERNRTLARLNELKDDQLKAMQDELGRTLDEVVETNVDNQQSASESITATDPPPTEVAVSQPKAPAERGAFSLIMDNLLWLLLALVAIAAGIWALLWRRGDGSDDVRTKRSGRNDDDFAGLELGDDDLIVDEISNESLASRPSISAVAQGTDAGQGYESHVEDADALAEADIYIAYGRYQQAIAVLAPAVIAHPENPEYRLKLLEVYAAMGDAQAFENELQHLQALEDPAASTRAEELRNGLGDDLGVSDIDLTPAIETDQLDAGDQLADLEVSVAEESQDEDMFDLSLDDSLEESDDDAADLELELELDDDFLTDLDSAAADSAGEETTEFELELDLEMDDEVDLTEVAAASGSLEDVEELDVFEELDELEIDDFSEFAGGDELSTKLDLARAYLDMGDQDGAREILDKVATDGTDEQKQEATELLGRIG
ncbi:MAG: pilus assembly protein FimV [Halieaceae bacterium]|jgi:pilus assembly protein FimV